MLDIIIFILLVASVTLNIMMYKKIEKLSDQLSKSRRKHLKYKTELGSIPRDYEDNERCYDGIAGDR